MQWDLEDEDGPQTGGAVNLFESRRTFLQTWTLDHLFIFYFWQYQSDVILDPTFFFKKKKLLLKGPETVEMGKWEWAEFECLGGLPSPPSFGLSVPAAG